MNADAGIETLLRELRDVLRALPEQIAAALAERHGGKRSLSAKDADALSCMLPIIADAVRGRVFSVRELERHAALNVAPALALRKALDATNSRALGRLLR